MNQIEKLHQTLTKLLDIVEQIDDEIYNGQECLGDRLAPFQTRETLKEIQNSIRYYQAKKVKVTNEINRIKGLLILTY